MAGDGPHTARPAGDGLTEVSIRDVSGIRHTPDGIVVNTGVPHLVVFTDDNSATDMVAFGRPLRWSPAYSPEGVNVNLVSIRDGRLWRNNSICHCGSVQRKNCHTGNRGADQGRNVVGQVQY